VEVVFNYDEVAESYVRQVDDNPYNAEYDRPAVLTMLPPVAGRDVLDAGCGAGWYTERLLALGARVTGIDASARMLAHARERLGERVPLHVVDLAGPLPFVDAGFEVVLSALVLHYLPDITPTLREFRRVLRFSTHHPCHEADRLEAAGCPVDYFATELVDEEWENVGRVRFHRRPLTAVFEALHAAGFLVERVVEPRPTDAFRERKPDAYARLLRRPEFLCVRATTRT
jgi:SAM-dependent methyltransferase